MTPPVIASAGGDTAPRGRPLLLGVLVLVIAVAVGITAATSPDGVIVSSDPGAPRPHVAALLAPVAVLIAVIALCPLRLEHGSARPLAPARLRIETLLLLVIAAAFPALVPLLPLPEDYVLLKGAMFLILAPCAMAAISRFGRAPSLAWDRPRVAVPWMLIPVVIAVLHDAVRSLVAPSDFASYSMEMLIIAAVATAITAGIGEEIFFRRLLQTRLEAVLGRWPGILSSAILFGLMHLPSHGMLQGIGLGTAQVIAVQGTAGVMYGWAWSRYRRLWVPILIHLSVNGTGVVLFLLLGS